MGCYYLTADPLAIHAGGDDDGSRHAAADNRARA